MKKYFWMALVLLAAIALGASFVLAQDTDTEDTPGTPAVSPPHFVDEDNNGICDFMESGTAYGPRGLQNGPGPGFIDENNDGVCDLMGTGAGPGPNGPQGSQNCPYFIDENNDGVCDRAGSGPHGPHHSGAGGQHHHGRHWGNGHWGNGHWGNGS